jgi:hypothetical protein
MRRREFITLLGGATVSSHSVWAQQADTRIADLVRAGKIRVALFLPLYAKDPITGELGVSWPTHSSTTTRSMRFMSGLADHRVGPSHHAGRHTPSMFSPLRYCVFGSLYRPSPDDLPSRLRLEYCWLLCERIDAAPLLCGGLLDDNEFGESGHKESSRFLESL